jgi:hypothetical protein
MGRRYEFGVAFCHRGKTWRVMMKGFRNFCFLFLGYLRRISSNGGFDLGLGKRISCAWKI